jgi:hypothetical protein
VSWSGCAGQAVTASPPPVQTGHPPGRPVGVDGRAAQPRTGSTRRAREGEPTTGSEPCARARSPGAQHRRAPPAAGPYPPGPEVVHPFRHTWEASPCATTTRPVLRTYGPATRTSRSIERATSPRGLHVAAGGRRAQDPRPAAERNPTCTRDTATKPPWASVRLSWSSARRLVVVSSEVNEPSQHHVGPHKRMHGSVSHHTGRVHFTCGPVPSPGTTVGQGWPVHGAPGRSAA